MHVKIVLIQRQEKRLLGEILGKIPTKKAGLVICQKVVRTVFENHRKSRIQHCEGSEQRIHFEWPKVHYKCPKMVNFGDFFKI